MGVMDYYHLRSSTIRQLNHNQIKFLYLIHKEFIYIHDESETPSIGTV